MAEKKEVKGESLNATNSNAVEVDHNKDLVTIKLFKDTGKYKEDMFVGVNGKGYQIKRGEEVQVPRNVAMVIEQSLKQDYDTMELIERETSKEKQYDF